MKKSMLLGVLLILGGYANADVTRHALPNNSTFPISRAVEVTADTPLNQSHVELRTSGSRHF
jgi:hypothetical protein